MYSDLFVILNEMGSNDYENRKSKKVMVPIEESLKPIFHKIPRKTTYVILID
jgi:hypothetical protein